MQTLFHFIGHHIPYWLASVPTSTQHDGSIRNLKRYVKKSYFSSTISNSTNTIPIIVHKWLHNRTIHQAWSNLLWTSSIVRHAQITPNFQFRIGHYMGNYQKQKFLTLTSLPFVSNVDSNKMIHVYISAHVALINISQSCALTATIRLST